MKPFSTNSHAWLRTTSFALAVGAATLGTRAGLAQDPDEPPPGPNAPPSRVSGTPDVPADEVVGRVVRVRDNKVTIELNKQGEKDTVTYTVPAAAEVVLNKEKSKVSDLVPSDTVRIRPSDLDSTVAEKVVAARVIVENPPTGQGATGEGNGASAAGERQRNMNGGGMGVVIAATAANADATAVQGGTAAQGTAVGPDGTVVQGRTVSGGTAVARGGNGDGDGVMVVEVVPDGPAAAAGIVGGDILTTLNRQPITSPASFLRNIERRKPGTTVTVGVLRPGVQTGAAQSGAAQASVQDVQITLASQQQAPDSIAPADRTAGNAAAAGTSVDGAGTSVLPGTLGTGGVGTNGSGAGGYPGLVVGPGGAGGDFGTGLPFDPNQPATLESVQQLMSIAAQEIQALRQSLGQSGGGNFGAGTNSAFGANDPANVNNGTFFPGGNANRFGPINNDPGPANPGRNVDNGNDPVGPGLTLPGGAGGEGGAGNNASGGLVPTPGAGQ